MAPLAALLVAALAPSARADAIPLSGIPLIEIPLHTERDWGVYCDFSFARSSVDDHVFAHDHRLYLQPWDPFLASRSVPDEECRLPLAVIADGEIAVYAMRISGFLIVAALADGASVTEVWLPLTADRVDGENRHALGGPVQLIDQLGAHEYVITASISRTRRDKEPLLALTIRLRPPKATK